MHGDTTNRHAQFTRCRSKPIRAAPPRIGSQLSGCTPSRVRAEEDRHLRMDRPHCGDGRGWRLKPCATFCPICSRSGARTRRRTRHGGRHLPLRAARSGGCDGGRPRRPRVRFRCPAGASRARFTNRRPRRSGRGGRPSSGTASATTTPFAVGLTCGGILDVFVEPVSRATFPALADVADDIAERRPVRLATVVDDVARSRRAAPGNPTRRRRGDARFGPARRRGRRRRPRSARGRPDRGTCVRAGRAAARRGPAGVRRELCAAAPDAGVRGDRLRGRGRSAGEVPRIPGDRV